MIHFQRKNAILLTLFMIRLLVVAMYFHWNLIAIPSMSILSTISFMSAQIADF